MTNSTFGLLIYWDKFELFNLIKDKLTNKLFLKH